ncbi:uncharacterized protein C15orf61 homolog [Planococcus citri]|uniref:uncharacterized protein C15orf61 homolog n=1 Tax=Planococcus citri TaxID=170843 RepID=UPI0031F9C1BC
MPLIKRLKPAASEVLTCYLKQCNEPHWTSYFVKYRDVVDDQRGMSNFNWKVGSSNYQILRTGCYPYIKYHCSKYRHEDLTASDRLMKFIKIFNLGIPALMYGIAAIFLITHKENVVTSKGNVYIYFLLKENKKSMF